MYVSTDRSMPKLGTLVPEFGTSLPTLGTCIRRLGFCHGYSGSAHSDVCGPCMVTLPSIQARHTVPFWHIGLEVERTRFSDDAYHPCMQPPIIAILRQSRLSTKHHEQYHTPRLFPCVCSPLLHAAYLRPGNLPDFCRSLQPEKLSQIWNCHSPFTGRCTVGSPSALSS